MISIHLVLVVLALVSFFVAFLGVPVQRVSVLALGLFLWCLSTVVTR